MKKSKIITITSVILICISLIAGLFLNDEIGSRISQVVTIITAIIGAIALFIQFHNDKEINKAGFLIEYNKSFYNDYQLEELFYELDWCEREPNHILDYQKYRSKIISYLDWLEIIASMVERKVLDLYTMDNIFAYRFFIAVNNKVIQENELIPFYKFYRGNFYLYDKWSKFERQRKIEIPMEETALEKIDGYETILEEIKACINK